MRFDCISSLLGLLLFFYFYSGISFFLSLEGDSIQPGILDRSAGFRLFKSEFRAHLSVKNCRIS